MEFIELVTELGMELTATASDRLGSQSIPCVTGIA